MDTVSREQQKGKTMNSHDALDYKKCAEKINAMTAKEKRAFFDRLTGGKWLEMTVCGTPRLVTNADELSAAYSDEFDYWCELAYDSIMNDLYGDSMQSLSDYYDKNMAALYR